MNWTVEWVPSAEGDLTSLWVAAPDRADVTAAADVIDRMLARNPRGVGESRAGVSRLLVVAPLAVEYDVIVDDNRVVVWHVWRWGAPAP